MIIRDAILIPDGKNALEEPTSVSVKQHRVRCTNYSKNWPPITKSQTTTSDYIRHYRKHHLDYPATENDEQQMISHMKNKCVKGQDTPWTFAASSSAGLRQPGEKLNEQTYRRLLTSFLIDSNSSFHIVESQSFNKLMHYCNSLVPTLSHQTVARDLQSMHAELKPIIVERFAKHIASGGCFIITLNAWTSGNKIPYLGITAHWMDLDWDLNDTVIGFKRLHGSHTAENLCSVLIKCLREFSIENHIQCVTADNHKVNDALFDRLEGQMLGWRKKHGQVRCMAHVMNLAAQKIISSLKAESTVTKSEALMAEEEVGMPESSPAGVLKMARHIMSKI